VNEEEMKLIEKNFEKEGILFVSQREWIGEFDEEE
jgi:hypothetical protein